MATHTQIHSWEIRTPMHTCVYFPSVRPALKGLSPPLCKLPSFRRTVVFTELLLKLAVVYSWPTKVGGLVIRCLLFGGLQVTGLCGILAFWTCHELQDLMRSSLAKILQKLSKESSSIICLYVKTSSNRPFYKSPRKPSSWWHCHTGFCALRLWYACTMNKPKPVKCYLQRSPVFV